MLALILALACGQKAPVEEPILADPPSGEVVEAPTPPPEVLSVESEAALVKRVVSAGSGRMRRCYERRLAMVPDLEGRVELEWIILQGAVSEVVIHSNTTGDDELGGCMVDVVRTLEFPGMEEGEIAWPFVFRPTG